MLVHLRSHDLSKTTVTGNDIKAIESSGTNKEPSHVCPLHLSIYHPQNNGSSLSSLFATGDWFDWRQRWNSFRGQRGLIDRLAPSPTAPNCWSSLVSSFQQWLLQWRLFLAENLFFSKECPARGKRVMAARAPPSSIQGLMPDILFTGPESEMEIDWFPPLCSLQRLGLGNTAEFTTFKQLFISW